MNIVIVGLNHKSAPLAIREKLSFPPETIGDHLKKLVNSYTLNEAVILSTCNRVEVTAVSDDISRGTWELKRFLSDSHDIPLEDLDEHLYVHQGEDAVTHLFRVSAGLDSMVMGEPQILGQVKDAFGNAVHFNTAGVIVNKLYHKTFSVAKRIRTETNIGANAVSISFAAVELAKKIFNDLTGKSAMLIGAGEMAELAAKHLINSGVKEIMVTNRTFERAVNLAKDFDGKPIMLREFPHVLKDVDIVIASTAAPKFIIKPDMIEAVMKERHYKPMFFIDISVPRNVDPLVNNVDGAYVYDIDDLQGVVESNLNERAKEAGEAEKIIVEEITNFYKWVKSLDVVPTIVALKRNFEEIRKGELEKALSQMPDLTDKQKKILGSLTSAIINKALHAPVTHLKKEAHNVEGDFYIAAAQKLFDLEGSMEAVKKAAMNDVEGNED